MTSLDVRDMLDLPNAAGPRPAKKQKTSGPRQTLKGLQREVQSLGGDNPISIVPEVPLFKKRRLASRKPAAHWEPKPFRNSARDDGLVLRHWRKKLDVPLLPVESVEEGAATQTVKAEVQEKSEELDDSIFAKFNVKVELPEYDDQIYGEKLTSEDWSREETDYLMDLVQEFDLRWPVIWDRYEYKPPGPPPEGPSEEDEMALVPESKSRTLEDLKGRYYSIAAIVMATRRPIRNMTPNEYMLHQAMTAYSPQQERARKQFAEHIMSRSAEERKEEENLLFELKRIIARSEKLNEERKELYARLEAPISTSNVGIYTSSQGLQQLVQQLMNADKTKKRKSLVGAEGVSPVAGPSGQQTPTTERRDSTQRESVSAPSGPAPTTKKGAQGAHERRKLTKEEEELYGVSHHERLTGGPSFRHDKITRQIASKSQSQNAKITNALAELGIPLRLVMATALVSTQFEALLGSINMMIDMRKMNDKLDAEIKLAEAQKAEREKRERKERGEPEPEPEPEAAPANGDDAAGEDEKPKEEGADDVATSDPAATATGEDTGADEAAAKVKSVEGEDEDENENAEAEETRAQKEASAAPSTRGASVANHKRSASVLSQVSDKSAKRLKK